MNKVVDHRQSSRRPSGQPAAKEHGGNIYKAAEETGIPISGIMDFSASINPLGVPASVIRAIQEGIRDLPHYPEPFTENLTVQLSTHLDIDPQSIICGNGSTELIYLLARALAPGRVLIPAPTFSEYERACLMVQGTSCVRHVLARENNFDLDPEAFIAAMEGCDMAFLCNPNNPTGRVLSNETVLAIAEAAQRMSCYLVVDEAFMDFVPEHSVVPDVSRYSHLIVLRSLTKFFALSGLRIGYGVFPGSVAVTMKENKEPWTVNSLAQKAGKVALRDQAYQKETIAVIKEEKQFLEQGFAAMGVEYVPSAVNYYLLKLVNARKIIDALRKKGILIRDCSNFPGLDGSYVRVAVRSREENTALLKGLTTTCAA